MRKTLLLGAVVLGMATILPSGTASAVETSASCDPVRSEQLLTSPMPIFGGADNRLWVDRPTTTTLLVCFDIPFERVGGGVIVVNATPGGSTPSVTHGHNPAVCNLTVLNPSEPAQIRLSFNVATATVCLTIEGSTLTLSFNQGSPAPPTVEIWRDGQGDLIDILSCPVEWTLWQLNVQEPACFNEPGRLL